LYNFCEAEVTNCRQDFFIAADAVEKIALRDSLIFPLAGSRPKYFTDMSCPTVKPRALAWLI
jgi:hypothetical protein